MATLADTACGYAAKTLMPPDREVLTIEYKVNFVRPAEGERFEAVGRLIGPGRTLTVCQGEVLSWESGKATIIAVD